MWLILFDALVVAFTLTIPFALCAEVVAEHGTEDKVLFVASKHSRRPKYTFRFCWPADWST